MTCIAMILPLKSCFCLSNVAALRKTNAMDEINFERICAMICDGRWEEAGFPVELDNMFYERFGMSGEDVMKSFSCPAS